jgi:hypothetical protein
MISRLSEGQPLRCSFYLGIHVQCIECLPSEQSMSLECYYLRCSPSSYFFALSMKMLARDSVIAAEPTSGQSSQ